MENKFIYDGKISRLYGIFLKNILLSILTLGIYSFWGKTNMRKYLASSVSFMGERFEYTGTGKELFKGFAKATPIILIILFIPELSGLQENGLFNLIYYVVIFYLIFYSIYSSLKYKYSRIT